VTFLSRSRLTNHILQHQDNREYCAGSYPLQRREKAAAFFTGYLHTLQDAPASSQPAPAGRLVELAEDETIRIPIREEQVFIEKRPVVTGELIVGKRSVQEIRRFSDTVQREVPHVEHSGDVIIHGPDVEK
jgi:hypothetical protein